MKMLTVVIVFLVVTGAVVCQHSAWAAETSGREMQLFDFGWRFSKGDFPDAQAPAFDDRQWRSLDLPHDWSIEDLPPVTNAQTEPRLYIAKGTWRFQKGDDPPGRKQNWTKPSGKR
jgi:hypothetical protein